MDINLQEEQEKSKRGETKEIEQEFDVEDMTVKVSKFCCALSGIDFYPYQEEYAQGIIRSLLRNDGEEVTALFSRQSGKSETNAVVSSGCMVILPILANMFPKYEPLQNYKNGIWIGIFAPSGDQAGTTFSRVKMRINSKNAEMILAEDDIDLELRSLRNLVALTNGSFCTAMSANKKASIESKTYHLIIIEEAQDVDTRVIRKSIQPMGASTSATIIKVGTANDKKSDFLDAIQRNRRRDIKDNSHRHYQYDYKVVQKYNDRYRRFIIREKDRIGELSDEFRMAYGCEFILERGMFLTEDKYREMENLMPNIDVVTSKTTGTQVAGIDWAKRIDNTIVTIVDVDWENPIELDAMTGEYRYKKRVLNWLELSGDDYESQFYQITEFLNKYNVRSIYMDSTGVGDVMLDRFLYYYDGMVDVTGWVFSTPSKSKMYSFLNQEIIGDRIEIPNGSRAERHKRTQKFKSQLLDLEKSWRGRFMVCSHPPEKGAHDDYPDSLALAILASQMEEMAEIEVTENDFYDRTPRSGLSKYIGRRNLFG